MPTEDNAFQTGWTSRPSIPLNPSSAIAGADWAIARYSSLGLKLPPGNRLQRARKFLSQFAGTETPLTLDDEEQLRRIVESTQSCFEHYLIARSTGTHSGQLPAEHVRKIEESLTGADTADEDANSIGRDTQFELFVAAVLTMGGASVRIAEPDLQVLYEGDEVGLAAKRVKRLNKLRRRCKDAVAQIERVGRRGFIAVNADLLIRDLGLEGSTAERGARFRERLAILEQIDEEFAANPLVMGCLVFGTDAIWHTDVEHPTLEFGFFRQFRVYPQDEEEVKESNQFFHALDERIDERMQQL